jgi:outer membrane protein
MKDPVKSIVILILLLGSVSVFAENDQRAVTVQECVSLSLQNNPEIRGLIEDENKSIADYKAAQGADSLNANFTFTPHAAAMVYDSKSTPPGYKPGLVDATNTTINDKWYCPYMQLSLTYSLYNPVNKAKIAVSRKSIDAAKLQGKKGRDDFVGNVKTLYYNLIRANNAVKLRQQMKTNYESRLASIRVYVQRGDRPVMDQSSAEVALSQVSIDLKVAQNLAADIMSELKAAMGIMNDAPDLNVADFSELPELTYSIDQIEGLINTYSADVLIAANRTEQARLAITAARMQHLPSVQIFGGYIYSNPSVDFQDTKTYQNMSGRSKWEISSVIGVTASINIFSGGRIVAQTDSAIADYNKAVYNQRRQSINARKNAQNYVRKLKELREQVKVVRLNIANSRMNLTLTQRSFDSGIVNQLVVQNAEIGLLQAQMSLVDAQCEYFKVLANLSNLIGLEESFLCGKN